MRTFLKIFFCFLFLFAACKKEEGDAIKPKVEILNPAEGSAFETGDTIEVKVKVTDNTSLKNLILNIYDNNGVRHCSETMISLSGTELTLSEKLIIEPDFTEGLSYYISARVFDETGNFGTETKSILLNQRALSLSGFVFDCSLAPAFPLFYSDAATGVNTLFASADATTRCLGLQETHRRVYLIPNGNSGAAKALNENGIAQWSLPGLAGQPFSFGACNSFEEFVFLHKQDGTLLEIGLSGTIEHSNLYNADYFGIAVAGNSSYTLSQMQYRSIGSRKLVLHDRANLMPVYEVALNDSITEMNVSSDGSIFYLLSSGRLRKFDPISKSLNLVLSHPDIGDDFAELSGKIVLTAGSSFGLFNTGTGLFNATFFSVSPLGGNSCIVSEQSNKHIYFCGASTIGRYDVTTENTLINPLPLSNTNGFKGFTLLMKP